MIELSGYQVRRCPPRLGVEATGLTTQHTGRIAMKKTHAILLVGATSILLLGGSWATGLLRFGPAPEIPPAPEPPKNSGKQTPQQLIVGKWECEAKGLERGKEWLSRL